MEDEKIIGLYFDRSEEALKATEQKYGNYLRQVAYRLLRNEQDTEEILGDTLLATWNSIPPAKPRALRFYLAKIARNLSMNRLDYQSAQCRDSSKKVLLHELEECIPAQDDTLEARELGMALNRFLGKLPREDCSIFLSRYFYGYTIPELEKKYCLPEYKIKYRLGKIRKQLAAFLQKEEISV